MLYPVSGKQYSTTTPKVLYVVDKRRGIWFCRQRNAVTFWSNWWSSLHWTLAAFALMNTKNWSFAHQFLHFLVTVSQVLPQDKREEIGKWIAMLAGNESTTLGSFAAITASPRPAFHAFEDLQFIQVVYLGLHVIWCRGQLLTFCPLCWRSVCKSIVRVSSVTSQAEENE